MKNTLELKTGSKRWQVLQPAIYLISILPGLAWWVLLPSTISCFSLALTTLAVVLIQHGVNVLNDAIDWKKGADSEKALSWVHFHELNLKVVRLHGILSFIFGVLLGIAIVVHYQVFEVLYVALPLVLLGYGYNASQWTLSYTAFGEWVTGLCYGPGVFGCMGYLFLNSISYSMILGSLAFGFLAVAVLFSHQPPQVLTDFLSGKLSFAVRHGAQKTSLVSKILNSLSLILLIGIFSLKATTLMVSVIILSLGILLLYRTFKLQPSPKNILESSLWLILLLSFLKIMGGIS